MCDEHGSTISDQSDSLCTQRDCELRKKGGVWICCLCDFGYRGADRNRYGRCIGCNHAVCVECKNWTRETAAELLKTDEEKEHSSDESEPGRDDDDNQEQAAELENNDDDSYGQRNDTSGSGSVYSPSANSDDDDGD